VAEPIGDLRRAVARVDAGDLDVSVQVYDGSEIGRLQVGFNEMVDGLRERATLRDLFGRQVGADVAEQALRQGVSLGGERREVGVLFVDVIGSTGFAVSHEPEDVVRRLNDFFAVVIATVDAYGGTVNKFAGDGALCLFGAPTDLADPATSALAAARDLAARLVESIDLRAAVGVSYGSVVAGNVGSESRYEYTVIGDAANEAARLSDLAKETDGLLFAAGAALEAASTDERSRWRQTGERVVRGRDTPTRLHVPAS
jgi:adenylate cyclase